MTIIVIVALLHLFRLQLLKSVLSYEHYPLPRGFICLYFRPRVFSLAIARARAALEL